MLLCLATCGATRHATTARAQDGGVEAPQPAASTDSPELQRARRHIASGQAFLEAENYDAALVEFMRAYELLEGHPMRFLVAYNIGQCHERMFRYDEALRYYRIYLDEGGDRAEDRATVEATIRALDGLLGVVVLRMNVPRAEVWVDQRRMREVTRDDNEVRVPGGIHTIELRAPGHVPGRQQVEIAARQRLDVRFELERVSDYRGLSPWLFWSSVGVAAACAVAGGVFGTIALVDRGDLQSRVSAGGEDAFLVTREDNARLRRLAFTADAFFGGAALFGATALVLAFLTNWGSGESEQARPSARTTASVRPVLAPNYAGVVLRGTL
jgi:tetratricopeptide (TPR) repeat protein